MVIGDHLELRPPSQEVFARQIGEVLNLGVMRFGRVGLSLPRSSNERFCRLSWVCRAARSALRFRISATKDSMVTSVDRLLLEAMVLEGEQAVNVRMIVKIYTMENLLAT